MFAASQHAQLHRELISELPASVFAFFFCGIARSSFKSLSIVKPYFGPEASNCFTVAVPYDRRMKMDGKLNGGCVTGSFKLQAMSLGVIVKP